MSKSILIIRAHKDICKNEMGLIDNHCQLLGIKTISEKISSRQELDNLLRCYTENGLQFDYLYLCTHGDKDGFDIFMDSEKEAVSWSEFSGIICEKNVLREDSIILLACCKGGLFRVAADIFSACQNINFVCGVKWTVSPWDLTTGFVVFIHNIEIKEAEPSYAAEKASLATDYTFMCYDRDEVEISPAYIERRNSLFLDLNWINYKGEWIAENEQIIQNVGKEVVDTYPKPMKHPATGEKEG